MCREQILKAGLPIVSATLEPLDFGKNFVLNLTPGEKTMCRQILTALEESNADFVFLCEHDVLYHPSHFITHEDDKFYFNTNVWKWKWGTDKIIWTDDLQQLSGMSGKRELLINYFKTKLGGFDRHYEPKENTENYMSEFPNIDIRHDSNTTKSKWSPQDFRNKKYAKGWKEDLITNLKGWNFQSLFPQETSNF